MDNSGRSRRDGWIAAGRERIFPLREVWRSSGAHFSEDPGAPNLTQQAYIQRGFRNISEK